MRRRFLNNYTQKNIKAARIVRFGDKYNIEGHGRIKAKIKSIGYRLTLYNSKNYKDKAKYRSEARECFEQLQEELKNLS